MQALHKYMYFLYTFVSTLLFGHTRLHKADPPTLKTYTTRANSIAYPLDVHDCIWLFHLPLRRKQQEPTLSHILWTYTTAYGCSAYPQDVHNKSRLYSISFVRTRLNKRFTITTLPNMTKDISPNHPQDVHLTITV